MIHGPVNARQFSSIDFEVTWWCDSQPLSVRKSRDQVVEAVKKALDDACIEIPFPYTTLTFAESLDVKRLSGNGQTAKAKAS